ncbi:MAG: hypothetical protein DRO00_01155 [Thermoproteota archaeon]|nr:MAG: hypothetical protein DRO00_01155 [Candidatus Korarchaeota archaeon]
MSNEEIEEGVKRLKTIEERVRWLLKNFPATRNDDTWLLIRYWKHFDGLPVFIPDKFIWGNKRLTSFESIRRARQKIQARGEFLPTDPKILKRRKKMMAVYRQYAREE